VHDVVVRWLAARRFRHGPTTTTESGCEICPGQTVAGKKVLFPRFGPVYNHLSLAAAAVLVFGLTARLSKKVFQIGAPSMLPEVLSERVNAGDVLTLVEFRGQTVQ